MKSAKISCKLIIAVAFIIAVSITTLVIIISNQNKSDNQETLAKVVLTKIYGATLQDYENLTNAFSQSLGDDKILLNYLYTVYGDKITENGYKTFLKNRIPSIAAFTAHDESSDLKVSTIDLKTEDALEGSKRYFFTIQVYTKKDASKTFTFKGNITLIKENNQWKVNDVSPYNK